MHGGKSARPGRRRGLRCTGAPSPTAGSGSRPETARPPPSTCRPGWRAGRSASNGSIGSPQHTVRRPPRRRLPANTATRSNSSLSAAASRPYDQSSVAASVRCRSRPRRAPPRSNRKRSSAGRATLGVVIVRTRAGGQLDRQGDAVEVAAQLHQHHSVVVGGERRVGRDRSLHEQLDTLEIRVERPHRPHLLGRHPERLPRRRHHGDRRAPSTMASIRPRQRPRDARSCRTPPTSRRPRNESTTASVGVKSAWSTIDNVAATAATRPRIVERRQVTPPHPVGELAGQVCAISNASRVLPTPPAPVSVTTRPGCTSTANRLQSSTRPTNDRDTDGRFPTRSRRGPQAAGTPRRRLATSARPARSFNRYTPRSVQSAPDNSFAVTSEIKTWPPWPAAMIRAARFNVGPK